MTSTLIYEGSRRVVQVGNSCALIIPYPYKKGLFEQNKVEGKWIITKDEEGNIHIEVKFSFLEKGIQKPEPEPRKVVRSKFKPKHKEEWAVQGTCEGCGQIGDLYKKGEKLLCKNCH